MYTCANPNKGPHILTQHATDHKKEQSLYIGKLGVGLIVGSVMKRACGRYWGQILGWIGEDLDCAVSQVTTLGMGVIRSSLAIWPIWPPKLVNYEVNLNVQRFKMHFPLSICPNCMFPTGFITRNILGFVIVFLLVEHYVIVIRINLNS